LIRLRPIEYIVARCLGCLQFCSGNMTALLFYLFCFVTSHSIQLEPICNYLPSTMTPPDNCYVCQGLHIPSVLFPLTENSICCTVCHRRVHLFCQVLAFPSSSPLTDFSSAPNQENTCSVCSDAFDIPLHQRDTFLWRRFIISLSNRGNTVMRGLPSPL